MGGAVKADVGRAGGQPRLLCPSEFPALKLLDFPEGAHPEPGNCPGTDRSHQGSQQGPPETASSS